MATTFADLKRFLDEAGLKYDTLEDRKLILIGFSGEPDDTTFRDSEGEPNVQIVVRLVEKGEFCVAHVPRAWSLAACDHRSAVCEAAARIQGKVKLVRFDLEDDGYLQPNVELALEKAPMCAEQLHRSIAALLTVVREFDPVIRHAMQTGEVDLDLAREDSAEPAPDVTRIIELGEAAGGLDALERLLGDSDAPPIEA